MRWKCTLNRQKANWHLWFAWFPVKTENGWVCFLERVNRRKVIDDYWFKFDWIYKANLEET